MRYLISRFLLCAILTSTGVIAEGATLVAATNRLPDPFGATFAVPFDNHGGAGVPPLIRIAQTFTTEVGGRLLSVSVTAASLDSDPTGLQLAVTALNNGQPGTILATSPLQGLYVNGRFTDIKVLNAVADFDGSQVMLAAQQQYALLFVAERHQSSYQVLGDQTAGTQRQYAGGELLRSMSGMPFQFLPGGDLVFEVTVEAIPEPITLTLALIGAAACWGQGRNSSRSVMSTLKRGYV
jgi:hypothetical protein